METEAGTAEAKKAYIAYIQLHDFLSMLSDRLKSVRGDRQPYELRAAAPSYARGFNTILKTTKEALRLDEHFLESIGAITELEEAMGSSMLDDILSQGAVLQGALRAFIAMYMAPEEKTKIGFHPDP